MNLGGTVRINKCGLMGILAGVLVLAMLYKYSTSPDLPHPDQDTHSDSPANLDAPINLRFLLSAAIDAAQQGGAVVAQIRESANLHQQSKGKTKEGANDPVTDGDFQSHLAMFYSLQKTFPGIEIISEEHDNKVDHSSVAPAKTVNLEVNSLVTEEVFVPAKDVRVWIDPLDATQEYTENLQQYVTTMVCVAVQGKPVIGVIHKPFSKTTSWAWVGKAVSSDLKLQAVTKEDKKDSVKRIIVSRSHAGKVGDVVKSAFGNATEVIPAGGAGYKTLEVVQGNADAYVHVTLIKKWDVCAGNAILDALQGNMTTLAGKPIDYGSREQYKNEGGVLATLHNHATFLPKLQKLVK